MGRKFGRIPSRTVHKMFARVLETSCNQSCNWMWGRQFSALPKLDLSPPRLLGLRSLNSLFLGCWYHPARIHTLSGLDLFHTWKIPQSLPGQSLNEGWGGSFFRHTLIVYEPIDVFRTASLFVLKIEIGKSLYKQIGSRTFQPWYALMSFFWASNSSTAPREISPSIPVSRRWRPSPGSRNCCRS